MNDLLVLKHCDVGDSFASHLLSPPSLSFFSTIKRDGVASFVNGVKFLGTCVLHFRRGYSRVSPLSNNSQMSLCLNTANTFLVLSSGFISHRFTSRTECSNDFGGVTSPPIDDPASSISLLHSFFFIGGIL